MPLPNVIEHIYCSNYATEENALFRQFRLSASRSLPELNNSRNVLLYVAEGSLAVTLGHYAPRVLEAGTLVFAPKNIGFYGHARTDSLLVASFWVGEVQLCNKFDLVKLQQRVQEQETFSPKRFPQLTATKEIAEFYALLAHLFDDGLNCLHFHRLKQEELGVLLRCYYRPDELYNLLKGIVGMNGNFKDFVLQYYKKVGDIREFAELSNMSLRNFQRKFKAEFKMSALKWWNDRRAEDILNDILNSNRDFADIALAYGFVSPAYFSTFCRKYFGACPSELRRKDTRQRAAGKFHN